MGLPCLYQSEPKWKGRPYPLSEERDLEVSWNPTWESEELHNTCESFKQSLKKFEEQITAPNVSQPAPDEHLNDLQKQGFSAIQEGNTYQPYSADLRNKVSFDIQPTNPQADIMATGQCEYWITTIDLLKYQEKNTLSSPDDIMLPEVYTDTVACIYTIYNTHTLKPFKELGLDSQRVKKLASKLHVHSVNFAAKLVHTRRALSSTIMISHREPVSGQACNPLDPHWFSFLFAVEELYGTQYQSGSFSLINVGSAWFSLPA